ncbi:MAG: hypothetical protein ACFHVJ_01950 [Aestuariibacter sp.]
MSNSSLSSLLFASWFFLFASAGFARGNNEESNVISTTDEFKEAILYQFRGLEFGKNNDSIDSLGFEEVATLLSRLLRMSKQKEDHFYSLEAAKVFENLPSTKQKHPPIKYWYAQNLSFLHQFGGAEEVLKDLFKAGYMQTQTGLDLVNLYMLTGRLAEADKYCDFLKYQGNSIVFSICSLWIKGVSGVDNQSATKLEALASALKNDQVMSDWINSILVDVCIAQEQPERALRRFRKIATTDHAPLLQIIDYHLVNEEFDLARLIMENDYLDEKYWIRYRLSHPALATELAPERKQILEFYRQHPTPETAFLISLWSTYIDKNLDAAAVYADINYQTYKKANNQRLMALVGN